LSTSSLNDLVLWRNFIARKVAMGQDLSLSHTHTLSHPYTHSHSHAHFFILTLFFRAHLYRRFSTKVAAVTFLFLSFKEYTHALAYTHTHTHTPYIYKNCIVCFESLHCKYEMISLIRNWWKHQVSFCSKPTNFQALN
jgi:hypothetical protein